MSMIFAAGDPGGSRVLLPILRDLEERGQQCVVLDHGFLARELPASSKAVLCAQEDIAKHLSGNCVYLFGSSTTDPVPLSFARLAQERHIPTVHVLDNWGGYRSRLCTDGQKMHVPDIYTALDEPSRQEAIAEGVPESCLMITGHPGLADAAQELKNLTGSIDPVLAKNHGLPTDKLCLGFINEPFSSVFGADCTADGHPGFTEQTVLPDFLSALAPFAEELYLIILAHPKQSQEKVAALWETFRGNLTGKVLALTNGRDILRMVSGVAGMASILLYKSWLAGRPTLSMQSGHRSKTASRYAGLDGLIYTDQQGKIAKCVETWLAWARKQEVPAAQPELELHGEALRKITELAFHLMGKNI